MNRKIYNVVGPSRKQGRKRKREKGRRWHVQKFTHKSSSVVREGRGREGETGLNERDDFIQDRIAR